VKKAEENPRHQPVIHEARQEWSQQPNPMPLQERRLNEGSFGLHSDRPSGLKINGYENSSLVSIPSSSIMEGDNESQLHSPPGALDLVVTLRREEAGFGFRIVGGTEEGSQVGAFLSDFFQRIFFEGIFFSDRFPLDLSCQVALRNAMVAWKWAMKF
jgi:hypothetical protein